ncbi:MAG: ornithine cyclodeaminase family protein [Nitrososphaerales archaeon]|nr:ornithine cyclodeaminase family protein [Nitrososphaerales archaeon]
MLSEGDVRSLLKMTEVVSAVETCFRQQASAKAANSPRTRTAVAGSTLSAMHASLPYLGVAGVKCYLTSKKGTRFVFVLFRLRDAEPLAVMGADILGRFRTGAASAVATKLLYGQKEFHFALCGSGRQAMTQVLAMSEVAFLESVNVWSPNGEHRRSLVRRLGRMGFASKECRSPREALAGSQVASAITSSRDPFIKRDAVTSVMHLNLCGSNSPDRSEASPDCIAEFQTVVVDDARQSREESGDLMIAARKGKLSWDRVVELKDVMAGQIPHLGKSLFKSNGVALEDVAVAYHVFRKASRSGDYRDRDVQLGGAKN